MKAKWEYEFGAPASRHGASTLVGLPVVPSPRWRRMDAVYNSNNSNIHFLIFLTTPNISMIAMISTILNFFPPNWSPTFFVRHPLLNPLTLKLLNLNYPPGGSSRKLCDSPHVSRQRTDHCRETICGRFGKPNPTLVTPHRLVWCLGFGPSLKLGAWTACHVLRWLGASPFPFPSVPTQNGSPVFFPGPHSRQMLPRRGPLHKKREPAKFQIRNPLVVRYAYEPGFSRFFDAMERRCGILLRPDLRRSSCKLL